MAAGSANLHCIDISVRSGRLCLLCGALATVVKSVYLTCWERHIMGMPVQTHPDAQFAGAIGAAVIGQRQRKSRMKEYLFFISLHGRRHTNPQGVAGCGHDFRVSDIPRDFTRRLGLLHLADLSAWRGIQWVIPGHTESVYCQQDGWWRALHITGFLRVKDSFKTLRILLVSY